MMTEDRYYLLLQDEVSTEWTVTRENSLESLLSCEDNRGYQTVIDGNDRRNAESARRQLLLENAGGAKRTAGHNY